jgi:RES domain-containing protein
MVYAASSVSLACLETIVHAPFAKAILDDLLLFRAHIPDEHVWTPEFLPEDWNSVPPSDSTRALGREWCESMKSAAVVVPSAVIPWETNVLLNPRHPTFTLDWVGAPEDFRFDARLWSSISQER